MNIKKIACVISFIFAALVYTKFASAAGYTLLVKIPGIQHENVNMSLYLVGIYNFLLSIVGIVAVMMLIVGGMRLITAAGNSAALSDGKDIISNAIVGLLLALLSWVVVSTINPDVLYIKAPVDKNLVTWNPKCTSSNINSDPCVCNDGITTIANPGGVGNCDTLCVPHCTPSSPVSCVENGYNNIPYKNKCQCADRTEQTAAPGADCQATCINNCLLADIKIGLSDISSAGGTNSLILEQIINSTTLQDGENRIYPLFIEEGGTFSLLMTASPGSVSLYGENTVYRFDNAPPFNGVAAFPDFIGVGSLGSLWVTSGDLPFPPTGMIGMWAAINANPGNCKKKPILNTTYDEAWVCPISLTLTDAAGVVNSNVDVAWIGFLKP
ncbi:MAG: hypothetical protein KAS78_05575 [Candidatus Pacebacteria bacterium]|nr:hypothetical protein [Candidatus Paceibacterota bacterium]